MILHNRIEIEEDSPFEKTTPPIKILLFFISLSLFFTNGCQQIDYYPDGFLVYGRGRVAFLYDSSANKETLVLEDARLNYIKIIDVDSDGKIDTVITNKKSEFNRGDPNTKKLFHRCQKIFSRYRNQLQIWAIKKKWKSLTPLDHVGSKGLNDL